jgi:AcrR family transcriptional regulator
VCKLLDITTIMTYGHIWVSVMCATSRSRSADSKTPVPSRRLRRSAELRERLFRAALSLFARKGYAETTVNDITEAADVGKGTFFNYFPSKEHILLGFAETQLSKLETIVREIRESRVPMSEGLRGLVHRMTEAPIQNPAVVRALLQAHLSSPVVRAGMFRLHREHQKLMGGLLRQGQQQDEVRRDLPAEQIAQILRQTIFGTLLFWSLVGDASLTERIEQSLHLLWGGIAALPRSDATRMLRRPLKVIA